jgi:hypothetical protein
MKLPTIIADEPGGCKSVETASGADGVIAA